MPEQRTKSQRAAEARYDQNSRRGVSVTLRLTDAQAERLAQHQKPGEARAATVKRLAGFE